METIIEKNQDLQILPPLPPILYRLSISRNNEVNSISFQKLFSAPQMENLQDVFISCSKVGARGLQLLSQNARYLRSLALSDCRRIKEDELLDFFTHSNLINLEIIYLYRTLITDESFEKLIKKIRCQNLRELSLVGCTGLSRKLLLDFFTNNDLYSLECLYINSLGINDSILLQIAKNF